MQFRESHDQRVSGSSEEGRDGDVEEARRVQESSDSTVLGRDRQGPGGNQAGRRHEGDKEKPEYHCTLVAKEIESDKREDLFAATPPLEAKNVLFPSWASVPGMRLNALGLR